MKASRELEGSSGGRDKGTDRSTRKPAAVDGAAGPRVPRSAEEPLVGSLLALRQEVIEEAEAARALLEAEGIKVEVPEAGRLCLALVGEYNAGKSTIVNALLGERHAITGDGPTTRRAQKYSSSHYEILDLPGSDARVEDEKEADRALGQAHAVLYVVSSKGKIDTQAFLADLETLAARGIPYLLVVNDKQVHQSPERAEEYRRAVLDSYLRRASERLGSSMPEPYWVNAAAAEKGRAAGGRRELVDASGILTLEQEVAKFLFRNEPFLRKLADLAPLREGLRKAAEKRTAALQDDRSRDLAEALEKCTSLEEELEEEARNDAEEMADRLQKSIGSRLARHVLGEGGERDAAQAARDVEELCETEKNSVVAAFERRVNGELRKLSAWVEKQFPEVKADRASLRGNVGTLPHARREAGPDAGDIAKRAEALTKLAKALAPAVEAVAAKGGARAAGVLAKRGGVEAGKALGRGAGEGAKVAGRAIGPLVVVALAGWEIFSAFRRAGREKEAKAVALREAEAKAATIAAVARSEILGRCRDLVADSLPPAKSLLREQLRGLASARGAAQRRLAEVSSVRERLSGLVAELRRQAR